jgi:RimJ/RimL family protein N-acetyltransferase
MWIRDPLPGDLLDLTRNMRQADAEEIFALRADKDPDQLAFRLYRAMPGAVYACVFGLDSEPRAIGFLGLWAKDETGGLCEVAMFAREGFPQLAAAFVRHVRLTLIPFLMDAGLRRVECRTLESYSSSRRLLRACGAVEEAVLPDFAPSGQSFVLCAWRRSDFSKNRRRPNVLHLDTTPAVTV